MAYSLSNKCAKKFCNRAVIVQIIVEDVVFFWNTVYRPTHILRSIYIGLIISHSVNSVSSSSYISHLSLIHNVICSNNFF